jgi:aminoglycoside phosphotransferase (APT) family kinase protein
MTLEDLVVGINAQQRTSFRLGERFAGGEQGAFALVDATGKRFVLKRNPAGWSAPYERARLATELLDAIGYPVPRIVATGTTDDASYAVQELLPGAPMGRLQARFLPRLLALNDLQAGRAPFAERYWRPMLVQSVLEGFDDFCVIATLRDHSPETAALLATLQAEVRANAPAELPADDIVHFDFTPANVLVDHERISGVIDWDGVCAGDRAFDLVTLLFYAVEKPELRAILRSHVLARASDGAFRLYLAHMIVRQVDWSIRFHTADVAAFWVRQSQLLADEFIADH